MVLRPLSYLRGPNLIPTVGIRRMNMSKRQQSAEGNNFNILYNIVYLINKSSGYNYVDFRLTINIDYFAQSDRLKVESL